MKRLVLIVTIVCTILSSMFTFAISLDGSYGDWGDKPFLLDNKGDAKPISDLTKVSWFLDSAVERLYFKVDRFGGGSSQKAWDLYVDLFVEDRTYLVNVRISPSNRRVKVYLYNEQYNQIYYTSGLWATANAAEFYIPVGLIIGDGGGGYSLDLYTYTVDDKAPDNGVLTISTISTYPLLTTLLIGGLLLAAYIYKKKGRLYDSCVNRLGIVFGTTQLSKTEIL